MKAICPYCQEALDFEDIVALKKHVDGCVRKIKKATKAGVRIEPAPQIDLKTLPLEFRLPLKVDSQNRHHKKHWASYDKSKNEWRQLIAVSLVGLKDQQFWWSKWEIIRLYKKPCRPFDYANLVGGAKPIPDALIASGIIVDDRPVNFECLYNQIEADEPATLLRLLEARYDSHD